MHRAASSQMLSGTTLINSTEGAGLAIKTPTRSRRASTTRTTNVHASVHVLLVEDNEISQKLLKKQLVRAGCSVATANDGVEALEYLLNLDVGGTRNGHDRVELILMGEWSGRWSPPAYTTRH
jgi:hypothetical protein